MRFWIRDGHVFSAYALQGLCSNSYLQLQVVLWKCKSETEVDAGVIVVEVEVMGSVIEVDATELLVEDEIVVLMIEDLPFNHWQ